MSKKLGPDGQVLEGQDEEETEGSQEGSEEESESNGEEEGHEATGTDLERMTQEQLKAEAIRLRTENARRRQREKDLREKQKKADEDAKKQKTDAERLSSLEATDKEKDLRIATLLVGSELRDYVAEKHPEYSKLVKRILPFVDLKDLDLEDEDAVREKVEKAVEDFVKDVPIAAGNGSPTDSTGTPVGGLGRSPARGSTPDATQKQRLGELFPGIYKTPRQG